MTNPSLQFRDDPKGRLKLLEQMDILRLPPNHRRKLVKDMAKEVRRSARQNLRTQKTVSGSLMARRQDTRNKRKMLRRLGKGMVEFNRGNDRAVVTWKGSAGFVADRHQRGIPERMTASKAAHRGGTPDYKDGCSRAQAKALLAEGYRQPIPGNKTKRVSQRWIMDNLSVGKAGLILKALRNTSKKRSWTINTPARPFLGADEKDAQQMLDTMAREALAKLRAKGAR